MVDTFSLLLTHGLIFLTCWRLLGRNDLDDETGGQALDLLGRPRAPAEQSPAGEDAPDA
jgi:hypothetical protein